MINGEKHKIILFYVLFSLLIILCGYLLWSEYGRSTDNNYQKLKEQIADIRREQHDITEQLGEAAQDSARAEDYNNQLVEENRRYADKFEENRILIRECREILERVYSE